MKVIVLGSAQDGGLPQLGAVHPQDLFAIENESSRRTGASLAVVSEDGSCLLFDASPDLRYQYFEVLLKVPEYAEARKKDPSMAIFQGIVLTHAHMGHYLGLAHLGVESANTKEIKTYVTPSMANFLSSNAPWNQLVNLNNIKLVEIEPLNYGTAQTFSPWEGLNLKIFTVPHRAEYTDTVGISVNSKVMYIPDIDSWEEWEFAKEAFLDHRFSIVDATFYELCNEGNSIARDLKKIPHPCVVDTVARFRDILSDECNIVLTHLNHSNPICNPSSTETQETIKAGFLIAREHQTYDC